MALIENCMWTAQILKSVTLTYRQSLAGPDTFVMLVPSSLIHNETDSSLLTVCTA